MKKKKLFAIIMSVLLVACFMPSMAFADPPDAPVVAKIDGTEYTDLHTALEAAKDGGTVVLQSDITLTSEWVPVAGSSDKNGKDLGFRGILDGNDKTISGLSITQGTSNIGLFTKLGENSQVKDLTIAGAKIDLSNVTDNQSYIGVLAGSSWKSTIANVSVTDAVVNTKAQYVGGIYGSGWGSITNCTVSGSAITGKDQVGGLVGYYWIGTIDGCDLSNNTITATEERAGGIVGKFDATSGNVSGYTNTIKGCTVSGGSATAPDFAGGITAQFMGDQAKYSITGNTVQNFALNAGKQKSALATIRDGSRGNSAFMNELDKNVTGNTLENIGSTLDESWGIKETFGTEWFVYQLCEAKVGSVKYPSLAEALSAAQADDSSDNTVTLLKNVTINSATTISKSLTIDLNGKTLSGGDPGALTISEGTVLTIQDSKGGGTITESLTSGKDKTTLTITGGTYSSNPSSCVNTSAYIVKRSGNEGSYTYTVLTKSKENPNLTSGVYLTDPTGALASKYYVSSTDGGVWTVSYAGGSSSSTTTTTTDTVTNTTEDKKTDTSTDSGSTTETAKVATTTATVKTETKTAADGTKTVAATVDTTTASKIVEKAVENKSEEVVIDTATTSSSGTATVTETAAGTTTKVDLPEQTVKAIAEKTEAAVTIKSDAAEIKLDTEAVKAVAEQAGETGTVNLVVETVAQNETKVEVDLKLVTSKGTVSDFKGGSVSVTVKLNTALAAKPVVCVYIDDNGTYHKVKGVKNADGTYTFETGHFSTYAVMAEEEANEIIAEQTANVDKLVGDLSLKARSAKTAKGNIKVTLTADEDAIKAIENLGYTVKYKFYRSTKKSASYKAKLEGANKTYTNTTGKKGTKYYYKARVMVYDAQGELIAKTALKQCKYAARTK